MLICPHSSTSSESSGSYVVGQVVKVVVSAEPPLLGGSFSPGPTAVSPREFLMVAPVMIHARALVKLACCREHRGLKPGLKVPETSQNSGP